MNVLPLGRKLWEKAKPAVAAVSRITVVTVCLNARDTIRLTLESIRRQSFACMEHVIIDGGSTDGTCEIVREYPVGHFVSEKDKGVYDAMDKGARAATGDVVIFLNAGDTFYDDRCCEEVAAFFDEAQADIVFGNLMPVYLDAADTHDHEAFKAGTLLDLGYIVNRRQLHDESIHHQATFYRRWIFNECSYACTSANATGEYNLLLNAVMKHDAKVKHISRPVARFLLGGISTRNFQKEWAKFVEARNILRGLYFPHGNSIRLRDEIEFMHRSRKGASAQRRLARRIRIKEGIKQSPVYKAYDRLMRSQSARTINPLLERLERAVAAQTKTLLEAIKSTPQEAHRRNREDLAQSQDAMAAQLRMEVLRESAQTQERLRQELAASAASMSALSDSLQSQISRLQINLADVAARVNTSDDFSSHGFRVSSQWDEDGLVQHLVAAGKVTNRTFVEFGVGDYTEANTRFLLQRGNWGGLILDRSQGNIEKIRNSPLYWRHQLTAVEACVDADNVNRLMTTHGMEGDIGLLSIDVDGVDYWIWKAITDVSPQILICEYNGLFGSDAAVTVPYDQAFDRTRKHFSWLYAGASLAALTELGREKGYTLVGTSAGGNNAFFVRDDVMVRGSIKPSTQPFTRPMFRESRKPDGSLSYLDIKEGIKLIRHLEVFDVRSNRLVTIGEACGLAQRTEGSPEH